MVAVLGLRQLQATETDPLRQHRHLGLVRSLPHHNRPHTHTYKHTRQRPPNQQPRAVGSIGINLAIWNARGSGGVFLPAGGYSINVAQVIPTSSRV